MPNKFNGFWESDILNKLPENVEGFKKELEPLLNAKIKEGSAISSSLEAINTPSVHTTYVAQGFEMQSINEAPVYDGMNGSGMGQGDSRAKAKQRVLTKPAGAGFVPVSSVEPESNYNPGQNMGYYGDNYSDIGDANRGYNSGSAQTLILICTAILVVMVVFVSLIVMKYVGM